MTTVPPQRPGLPAAVFFGIVAAVVLVVAFTTAAGR